MHITELLSCTHHGARKLVKKISGAREISAQLNVTEKKKKSDEKAVELFGKLYLEAYNKGLVPKPEYLEDEDDLEALLCDCLRNVVFKRVEPIITDESMVCRGVQHDPADPPADTRPYGIDSDHPLIETLVPLPISQEDEHDDEDTLLLDLMLQLIPRCPPKSKKSRSLHIRDEQAILVICTGKKEYGFAFPLDQFER